MNQSFITVVLPFETELVAKVEKCIDRELGNPVHDGFRKALDDTRRIHFASVVVAPSNNGRRSHLIIEASSDGTLAQGIAALATALAQPLTTIFAEANVPIQRDLATFLTANSLLLGQAWWETLGLPFAGTPGMTCERICAEDELAKALQDVLEKVPHTTPAFSRLTAARNALWARGNSKWAFEPEPAPCLEGAPDTGLTPRLRLFFGDALPKRPFDLRLAAITSSRILKATFFSFAWPFVLAPLLLLLVLWMRFTFLESIALVGAALLVIILVLPLRLRLVEVANTPVDREPDAAEVEEIMRHESWTEQNLLFSVSTLRSGLLSRIALRIALFSVGASKHFCRPGFLGSNSVIHFARWFVIPGTDQLVFLSNYDGSWQGYVGDFVMNTAGASGVSSIWSNCLGFPPTRLLSQDGAADRDRLVRWARRQQRPVPFWYSRYPRTTTDRVRTNAAIRQGLANASTAQDAEDWLACFGSAPRPPTDLEFAEIPALAFGGFSKLPHSAVAAFRLRGSPDDCRRWLGTLEGRISYGEDVERSEACVVALSAAGMRKLDVKDMLETFPVAFQQGMEAPERARANGDVGTQQRPAAWRWGSGEKVADVYVVLYSNLVLELNTRLRELRQSAFKHHHRCLFALSLKALPGQGVFPVEAFGFVDGVSQPAIRGARRAAKPASDVLAPGEFILGYADELGRYPSTPTIGAGRDPEHRLHEAGLDPNRQRPLFRQGDDAVRRDLGRNGTYLVVRHLEQHVKAFQDWLDKEAARLSALDPWWDADKVAAKVVGRWKNGTSLVRNPHGPGDLQVATKKSRPDNGFLFAKEDPTGAACPLGAHIRRANPRDGLAPGKKETHATVQTHRLLRVGRSYETPSAQGIMFMCIAADIERQFEFVQQRWLLNPFFSGLQEESDPLLGRCPAQPLVHLGAAPRQPAGKSRAFSMPGPTGGYRARGLKDFVTVRGGGYFFVPSRAAFGVLVRS